MKETPGRSPMRSPGDPGILFLVATPIGNLEDITARALRVLREADIVAAEDTRHTRRLLQHFGIAARVVSLHEHNERVRAASGLSIDAKDFFDSANRVEAAI